MTLIQFVLYAKKFFIALLAALAILGVCLEDGTVTPSEWITIVLAFGSSLGVYQINNEGV